MCQKKRGYRFLIDNEICLTRLNEIEEPFPDWLPKSAHHSVYGCYKCQDVCPKNNTILSNISDEVCFNEEETEILLTGVKRAQMPENLLIKVKELGIEDWCLKNMPKNLKAIFDNVS